MIISTTTRTQDNEAHNSISHNTIVRRTIHK